MRDAGLHVDICTWTHHEVSVTVCCIPTQLDNRGQNQLTVIDAKSPIIDFHYMNILVQKCTYQCGRSSSKSYFFNSGHCWCTINELGRRRISLAAEPAFQEG